MAQVDIRTFIRATPQRVWKLLADFPLQRVWMADVRRLEVTSAQDQGMGTVIEVTSTLFGLPLVRDIMEVTSWRPPVEYAVAHRGQFSGSGLFRLEPTEGGTIFTWQEEFEPPLGALGELAFDLLVGPHLYSVFRRSMENLRLLAEAQPSPPAPLP